jgi:hypothetical protein
MGANIIGATSKDLSNISPISDWHTNIRSFGEKHMNDNHGCRIQNWMFDIVIFSTIEELKSIFYLSLEE